MKDKEKMDPELLPSETKWKTVNNFRADLKSSFSSGNTKALSTEQQTAQDVGFKPIGINKAIKAECEDRTP